MEDDLDVLQHPPSKRRKLSLSEIPPIINAALETAKASDDFDFANRSCQKEGTGEEKADGSDADMGFSAGTEYHGLIKPWNELHLTATTEHPEECSSVSKLSAGAEETVSRVGQWVSQEMEDENTQIQSSLPLYLDHVYGQGLGLCRQTPPKRHDSTNSGADEYGLAMQMESQGFFPTLCGRVEESTRPLSPKEVIEAPISPLLFDSPSPESSPNKEAPNSSNLQNVNTSSITTHFTAEVTSSKNTDNAAQSCSSLTASKNDSQRNEATVHKNPSCIANAQEAATIHRKVSSSHGGRKRRHLLGCRKKRTDEKYTCPPTCTCLVDCTEAGKNVCLFGIVLQVNCVMEVACRGGSMAGQTVQMSSLLLGDPTKSYFKLSLWREAAVWVERIAAGDIVYFTNIKLKRWQRESVGHTVMCSTILNLHLPKKELPSRVRRTIPPECLESLKQWAMKQHAYLFAGSSPTPKSQIVLLADEPEKEVHLYLLSVEASLWHSQLSRGVGEVWEFLYLTTALEGTQGGCYSLQTTSRSQLRSLKSDCDIASDILQRFPSGHTGSINKNYTVEEILTTKESGTFECQARALSLRFQLEDGSKLLIGSLLQLSSLEVISQLCHAVYIGCESCSKPLRQDINGVYCQCISCMSRKPGGYPTSSHYFRPLTIVLHDGSVHVEVTASHTIVSKIFDVNPISVAKASLAQDLVQCQELAENLKRTETLAHSSVEENLWIISCMFTKDENSFLESVSLSLLDWQHVQK